MWKHVLGQGLFQTALLLLLTLHPQGHVWLLAPEHAGLQHNTMIFNVFVWCQMWNMFNCRRVHDETDVFADVLSSKLLTNILLVIGVGQFVIITFCGELASTVPLSFDQWVLSIVLGASALPLGSVLRSL
jgi:Ca2+-transporting ATPase